MGYIIVIEGTDGCGKQTQTKLLYERLKDEGYNVMSQSFPNYDSPSSSPIKMYLAGEFGSANDTDAYQASSLYAVDRLCTYKKDLKEFYDNGGIIVFDRYVESNMLFQASKIKDDAERDKFLEWLDDFEFGLLKLPKADKVLFLDVPIDVSLQLIKERGEYKSAKAKDIHEESREVLENAYNSGKYVGKKFGWDIIPCTTDDNKLKSIEEISELIWDSVQQDLSV